MRIIEIINQHRRDFTAKYECEHCKLTVVEGGYDDEDFHKIGVPNMVCKSCGKKSPENYRPLTTKYDAATVV